MAELTAQPVARPAGGRTKFLVGGAILLAAVIYLIVTSIGANQQYFITVHDLKARETEYIARKSPIRISGAVVGDTIKYDGHTLSFDIVHIPDSAAQITDEGGLAEVLHTAVTSPNAERVTIVVVDQPKPDLLKNEAQAIVTGKLGEDGDFHADELLLKCPTRYQEQVPDQTGG